MGRKDVFAKDFILPKKEIDALKAAPLTPEERLVVYGLLYTGMRIGEFVHLKKEWIDWDNGMIRIPKKQPCACYDCMKDRPARKPKKNGEIPPPRPKGIWLPKSKAAIRTIPLKPKMFPVFDILKQYFETHETIMETIGIRKEAWNLIISAKRKAHIKHKLFPHAFRSTYATQLAISGFNEIEITQIMGWSKYEEARTYVELAGTLLDKAYDEKMKPF